MAKKTKAENEVWSPGEGFRPLGLNVWKPELVGEKLHGFYLGCDTVKSKGEEKENDTFLAFQVKDFDTGDIWSISGASLVNLLKHVDVETEIWIVYNGVKQITPKRRMKDFTVYARSK